AVLSGQPQAPCRPVFSILSSNLGIGRTDATDKPTELNKDSFMSISTKPIRTLAYTTLSLVAVSGLAVAQDQSRGWRRVNDPASASQAAQPASPGDWQNPSEVAQSEPPAPQAPPVQYGPPAQQAPPQAQAPQGPPPNMSYELDGGRMPSRLIITRGTYV